MFPWGKGLRNFGWYCKRCNKHFGGGVQLYMCQRCGDDPANEYCLNCAGALDFNCPICRSGRIVKG